MIEGTLVKVCSWYDNEWGFSNRMLDTARRLVEGSLSVPGDEDTAMNIIKMTSLDLRGKRVLIREDLNVPIKDGEVTQRRADPRRAAHHPGRTDGEGPRAA